MSKAPKAQREVKFAHLGLPEARYYLGCKGHMHAFRRAGYRSGAFVEDAVIGRSKAAEVAA